MRSAGGRATITASFASFFVGRDAEEASGPLAADGDMKLLLEEVQGLRQEVARLAGNGRGSS